MSGVEAGQSGLGCSAGAADESVVAAFERVVAAHPSRLALMSDRWSAHYDELNAAANRLAHAILARGGAPANRVAVLMAHDTPAIAAMLAVLKAGRIAVALNASHPPARLRELFDDAGPACIVADAENHETAVALAGQRGVVSFEETIAVGPAHNPSIAIDAGEPAIIVYTSGSTGLPRGVMKTHRQVVADAASYRVGMEVVVGDRIPLFASVSNGQGIAVTSLALLNGATLCPFALVLAGVADLAEWMIAHEVNVYASSASIFRSFMRTLGEDIALPHIRLVWLASEPATSEDFRSFVRHFAPTSVFVHTYSSSETSNMGLSRLAHGDAVPDGRLPMAGVSKNQELLLLDDRGLPVARGQAGEIVVRSRTLAAGYWRNPELTAERFSTAADGSGMRLFHTGDLARVGSDGSLEFVGRKGARVKIRGNTIEPAEVETALLKIVAVDQALVTTVERHGHEPELVGYVVTRTGHSTTSAALRRALRLALPSHMVPSRFIFLDQFPSSPSGKIDRDRLPAPSIPDRPGRDRSPETATETMLVEFWANAFGLKVIDRDDDFFDLGGDSLIGAEIAAYVRSALGVPLNLEAFANHPILAELASFIDELRQIGPDGTPSISAASRDLPMPMSYWEERTWSTSRTPKQSAGYTVARPYQIIGLLDVDVLRECMTHIARRQEILRTTYAAKDGHNLRVLHRPKLVRLELIDLTGAADPDESARRLCTKESAVSFDLVRGPLIKFLLIRLRTNEHWLLRVGHHIISDAPFGDLYFQELGLLYEARMRDGVLPAAAPQALQYADYAAWQRQVMHEANPVFAASIEWWKKRLAGAPDSPPLPFKRQRRQSNVDSSEGRIYWGFDPPISRALDAIARVGGATPYMVRLAGFAALIANESGEHDVVLGSYVSMRDRVELRKMLGYFTNLATLRLQFEPKKTFGEWLSVVRARVLELDAQCAIPYGLLCDELRRTGVNAPAINTLFHMSRYRIRFKFADMEVTALPRCESFMPWGFTLAHDSNDEEHRCRAIFDATVYDPAGVRAFVGRYVRLLDAIARQPERTIGELLAQ
jgi:amino acid adenylation domain-containing protein